MDNQEKLILSLIKDDLINHKLVNGLADLGLDADSYLLHLKETILTLMGFTPEQRTDALYAEYMDRMGPLRVVNLWLNPGWVDLMARDIYGWLLREVGK